MKNIVPVVLLLAVIAACGAPTTTTETLVPPPVDREFDLTDPTVQAEIGAPPFEPVEWQRFVGPFTAIGDRQLPNPAEVELMNAAAQDVPEALAAPVRNVIRTADAPAAHLEVAGPVAVAVGPDVYLLDRVFTLEGGTTRYAITYALNHEIAHVHQWFALDQAYLNAAARGEVPQIDLADGSRLVADFAAAVGWSATGSFPDVQWQEGDANPSTEYGSLNPAEDMAEAVALATVGRSNWLDEPHIAWVTAFLGMSTDDLNRGWPWVPANSEEVNSVDPLYDVDAVEAVRGSRSHVEPTYFQLPANAATGETLSAQVADQLGARQLLGRLEPIADDRVPRWGGYFDRGDGSGWWVEVWDVPATNDEEDARAILTYVMLW